MPDRTPNEHAEWLESQAPSDPGLHSAQALRDRKIEAAHAMLVAAAMRKALEHIADRVRGPNETLKSDIARIARAAIAQAEAAGIKLKEPPTMPDDVKYPRYLGDAVYASVTHGMIKLHTSDGLRETNTVWFEVKTLDAFLEWLADMRASMIAERETKDA